MQELVAVDEKNRIVASTQLNYGKYQHNTKISYENRIDFALYIASTAIWNSKDLTRSEKITVENIIQSVMKTNTDLETFDSDCMTMAESRNLLYYGAYTSYNLFILFNHIQIVLQFFETYKDFDIKVY